MSAPFAVLPWVQQDRDWPAGGRHLLAHQDGASVVVYQAYRPEIADHAVAEQRFGGRASDVRVQWDPDHDPHGRPLARRAVQLGLRGETLRRYARDWPVRIVDVTGFVVEQREVLRSGRLAEVLIPVETPYLMGPEGTRSLAGPTGPGASVPG